MTFTHAYLVGAGGTGAILAPLLARLLQHHDNFNGELWIIDADRYEEHNSDRQPIGNDHIGASKADHVRDLCLQQGIDGSLVRTRNLYVAKDWMEYMTSKDDQNQIWIAAVDNDATRHLMAQSIHESDRPNTLFISPGNADAAAEGKPIKGQVLWFGRSNGRCFGINPIQLYDNIREPGDVPPIVGTCSEQMPSHPQLLACNALAAAFTLSVITEVLDATLDPTRHAVFFQTRSRNFGCNLA